MVAQLPPDDEARDLLVSLNATKPKKSCLEHGKELVLRCVTDGKEICVDCFMNEHSGHQIEGIHKKEQNRLYGFWKSHKTELEVRTFSYFDNFPRVHQGGFIFESLVIMFHAVFHISSI